MIKCNTYDLVEDMGFMVGTMSIPFVDWVLRKARHPVKLALRGAEPIAYAARKLAKIDPKRFEKTLYWRSVCINKDMVRMRELMINSIDSKVSELAKQHWHEMSKYWMSYGMKRPWTLVDTGVSGRMSEDLGEEFAPVQNLFFASSNPEIRGFVNERPQFEALCNAIKVPWETPYLLDDVQWEGIFSQITNFMDASPKNWESPSVMKKSKSGQFLPLLQRKGIDSQRLRINYYIGVNKALDKYKKEGKIPSVHKIIAKLFSNGDVNIKRYISATKESAR